MMADNLVNEAKNVIKSMDQDLFDAITKCIRESSSPDSDSELVNLANELTLEDYKYLTKDLMVFQTEDILSEDDLSELERSCLIVKYGWGMRAKLEYPGKSYKTCLDFLNWTLYKA